MQAQQKSVELCREKFMEDGHDEQSIANTPLAVLLPE